MYDDIGKGLSATNDTLYLMMMYHGVHLKLHDNVDDDVLM